jgi:hypothetical protein
MRVGAFAIVHDTEPRLVLAESGEVIARALALTVVADTDPNLIGTPGRLHLLQEALLEERWADALSLWIDETGCPVDVFEEFPEVWTEEKLDAIIAPMEIRTARIFTG